ncbi:MAG TPA: lamin tail domain-containing protein [Ignavibacteria bacterium]|nr:lamin tail domain-containing protein [Ignavibacteria bacterium]
MSSGNDGPANVGNFIWHNRSTNNPVGKFDGVRVAYGSSSSAAWTSLNAYVSSSSTPPTLTADDTNNDVDHDIDITFTDNETWRGLITSVKIGGTALDPEDYLITAGNLQLKPSIGNSLLTTSGTKAVTVEATGYLVASVSQVINPGSISSTTSTAIISTPLTQGATSTITCTAKDQYNNLIQGYYFKYEGNITNTNPTTAEKYNIDGSDVTATVSNVQLTTATNSSGIATFDVIMPGFVDANDGISIQVQESDGSTNISSPFTYTKTAPQITLTGTDPGTSNFSQGSTNNILYRVKVDVLNDVTTLNTVSFSMSGNYISSDIQSTGLKLWYSTDANFGSDATIGSVSSSSAGSGETITFNGLSQQFSVGTGYLFLTVDINSAATSGNNIMGQNNSTGNFSFSSGTFGSSTFGSGNSHTILDQPLLLFSEYIEGTSNNKVFELFNASTSTINLSDYVIVQFNNGASRTTGTRFALTITNPTYLAPGATFVIVNSSANSNFTALANLTTSSSVLNFNGDDALAIYKATDVSGTTIKPDAVEVDIFGKIGEDPGTYWGSGSTVTADKTLKRKNTIYYPVSSNPASFDPATEYDSYTVDTYSGLGIHDFGGTISSSTTLPPRAFTNLTLDGSGINVNLAGTTIVTSSFNMANGELSIGNKTLTLNGTVTGNGTITGSLSSNLTIGGTGDLGTICFTSGSGILNNLTINRISSGSLTLGSNLTINGNLTLTSGKLVAASDKKLIFGTGATITGGSSTSFIDGPVDLNTNSTDIKTLHIGNGTDYRTVGITPTTTDATTYSIEFKNTAYSDTVTFTSPLVKVSTREHYLISRTSGSANAYITISWDSLAGITNLANLRVGHWNSTSWEDAGRTGFSGDEKNGTITSGIVSSFSPFAIASTSDQPLPVILSGLTSSVSNRDILLRWSTSSEANNSGFDVERKGMNESNWMKAGYIQGSGNSNSTKNYSFIDRGLQTGKYQYRLKQIDFNGNCEYFDLNGYVEVGVPNKYDISQNYPNPFNPVTKIDYNLPFDSKVSLRIYDVTGREVKNLFSGDMKAGYYTQVFDASSLSSGVYFYRVVMKSGKADFVQSKKMVVLK